MNVFISWSGEPSRQIAEVLRDWIPTVIQAVKPYFSPKDVDKGTKWDNELSKKLNDTSFGIICVTSNNTTEPWILFEAGALANKLDKSRVCPLLFNISKTNITGPLATFQMTSFNEKEFKELIESLNGQLEDPINQKILDNLFSKFYPELKEKITNLIKTYEKEDHQEIDERSDREVLDEILLYTRKIYHDNSQKLIRTYPSASSIKTTISKIIDKFFEKVVLHHKDIESTIQVIIEYARNNSAYIRTLRSDYLESTIREILQEHPAFKEDE